jgi:hypothetical protein
VSVTVCEKEKNVGRESPPSRESSRQGNGGESQRTRRKGEISGKLSKQKEKRGPVTKALLGKENE